MDFNAMSDSELIKCYLKGNEAALAYLIKKHQQRIFSYILMKIQDESLANDIFQDTFIKVIKTLRAGRYKEEGKFLPWTLRIAHNLVIDHFRKAKRVPTVSPNEEYDIFKILKDSSPDIESEMIRTQIERDLHQLIKHLPEEQLNVLRLRFFSGLSFKEIAEQTDVSINTALGRMRYALINLRKLMEQKQVSLSQQ